MNEWLRKAHYILSGERANKQKTKKNKVFVPPVFGREIKFLLINGWILILSGSMKSDVCVTYQSQVCDAHLECRKRMTYTYKAYEPSYMFAHTCMYAHTLRIYVA